MKTEYLECNCHSPEHTLVFHTYDDEPMIYMHVFLKPDPFFKRIWNSIKYIFGYKCKYGHFDEFIMNPDDADKLIEILQRIKK